MAVAQLQTQVKNARENKIKSKGALDLYNEIALREIASIMRSDLSLMISEHEMTLLKEIFNILQSGIL